MYIEFMVAQWANGFSPLQFSSHHGVRGVFGITRKLLKSVREWCLLHDNILNTCQVIKVSDLEIIYFPQIFYVFCHFILSSIFPIMGVGGIWYL